MREFRDQSGKVWTAAVQERTGPDYKGRYFFWFEPRAGGEGVVLSDVRWNSEPTARRTLGTMSEVELRRRLRSALGRDTSGAGSVREGK